MSNGETLLLVLIAWAIVMQVFLGLTIGIVNAVSPWLRRISQKRGKKQ